MGKLTFTDENDKVYTIKELCIELTKRHRVEVKFDTIYCRIKQHNLGRLTKKQVMKKVDVRNGIKKNYTPRKSHERLTHEQWWACEEFKKLGRKDEEVSLRLKKYDSREPFAEVGNGTTRF